MKTINALLRTVLIIGTCMPTNTIYAMNYSHNLKKDPSFHEKYETESPQDKTSINKLLFDAAASIESEQIETIRKALDANADVETKGLYDSTSLIVASTRGYKATVEELLKKRANVNAQNKFKYTALKQAAYKGHTAIASLLLDHNAMIDPVDADGRTPLMAAIQAPHIAMIELLLEKKADVNSVFTGQNHLGTIQKHTVLRFAACYESPLHKEVIRMLIFADTDPDSLNCTYKGSKLTIHNVKHNMIPVVQDMMALKEKIFLILEENPWPPEELHTNDTLLDCLGSVNLIKIVGEYVDRQLLDDYTENLILEQRTKQKKTRTVKQIEYEQQIDHAGPLSAEV